MSLFNTKTVAQAPVKTTNLAGGEAYVESAELELVSLLLTNFVQGQFYRSADDSLARLKELVASCDPEFVAKAAVFARDEFHMRSVTHATAAEVALRASGKAWARRFFSRVIQRPDDMTEILAYFVAQNGRRPLPNAMKRGFADAFNGFDGNTLAKYRGEGKGVSLVDVVNLVHPRPTERNAEALRGLAAGTLRVSHTWESQMSAAGQNAETEEDKIEAKAEVWKSLVTTGNIGYMALLRNLRNIITQADDETKAAAIGLLGNVAKVRGSKILPFRFRTAFDELKTVPGSAPFIRALSQGLDLSVSNVPTFEGSTLVAVDLSGSMKPGFYNAGKPDSKIPVKIASLFASALYKGGGDVDVMAFANTAKYLNLDPSSSVLSNAEVIENSLDGGTDFHVIFRDAKRKYDRIIILSDMQAWMGGNVPKVEFEAYRQKFGASPKIFSVDLTGLGSLQFPEKDVFAVAGFSEKIFDLMAVLERDKSALVNAVKAVEL